MNIIIRTRHKNCVGTHSKRQLSTEGDNGRKDEREERKRTT